mgnify:CR=1 FL=1
MTHIPRYFLGLFASLRIGDELILNKGPGEENWKVEIVYMEPEGIPLPIPPDLWGKAFGARPWDWQGKIRFYSSPRQPDQWMAAVTIRPPIDTIALTGMVEIKSVLRSQDQCQKIA